jgi:HSP20 family molecular chaperone IbpA
MNDYLKFSWDWGKDWQEWVELFNLAEPLSTLPASLLSSHFPPCNYFVDEDGTLHFEFAVAGYKQEEIDLKFEDDRLILSLNPKDAEESKSKYFQKAIKRSVSVTKARVPFVKYDTSKVVATLTDGILLVTIPVRKDAKPVSVKIDIK